MHRTGDTAAWFCPAVVAGSALVGLLKQSERVPCWGIAQGVCGSPVLLGELRVTDVKLTCRQSPGLYPLGDFYLVSVFVISRNFGKRLKDLPAAVLEHLGYPWGVQSRCAGFYQTYVEAQNSSST